VIRRATVLFFLFLTLHACREQAGEPALEERGWGTSADTTVRPDAPPGARPGDSTPMKQDAPAADEGGHELSSGPRAPSLSREALLRLLKPATPPPEDEVRLLRVGLDALGEVPPSPQRSHLMRRLLVAWARRDASGAMAMALTLPEAPREEALVALAPALASRADPDALAGLLALAALPDPAQRRLLGRYARSLVAGHPAAARACHAALGARGDRVAMDIARELAARDEAAARIWVAAIENQDLRAVALGEVAAAGGEAALEGIPDAALREEARARALIRLAQDRPQAALLGLDAVGDARWRAEILETAAWTWLRQGFPDLAQEALKDTAVTPSQRPLRRLVEHPRGATELSEAPRSAPPPAGDCEGLTDPHLSGACRARRVAEAVERGERDRARAALQDIDDDTWRAAALVPLYAGLDADAARAWLRRSQALRERLPAPAREDHLLAVLERCALPPLAHLRDGLALLQAPALRRGLIEDAAAALPADAVVSALALLATPAERALFSVAFLERGAQ
jgi:hypothetical protein